LLRAQRIQLVASVVLLFSFVSPMNSHARIHAGIGVMNNWDFSDSTFGTSSGDMTLMVTNTLGFQTLDRSAIQSSDCFVKIICWNPAQITIMSESTVYESLWVAPTDPTQYEPDLCFAWGRRTFVMTTREGHYAKFRTWDDFSLTPYFDYVYQDDGTPLFYDDVPTHGTTWGRIKELFE
jgi:hypothetical protein